MKKRLLLIGFITLILAGPANALVIDFDDLPWDNLSNLTDKLSERYGGYTWDWVPDLLNDLDPINNFQFVEGPNGWLAYNVMNFAVVFSMTPFDFPGANFISPWAPVTYLTVNGYTPDSISYTSTFEINNKTPTWFQADWTGLIAMSFITTGWHLPIDDFPDGDESPAVPEPATLLLLGSSAISLIAARKKIAEQL